MTNPTIKKIFNLNKLEKKRQKTSLSLIASENLAYTEVLKISSSILTNKYAEGYPGKRYYGGCKYVDKIENIAIEEAKKAFKCKFANVQSLSGSTANFSIYKALLKPGDVILGMELSSGGHLTHTSKVSFVSYIYNVISYKINENEDKLDFNQIKDLAIKHKPKLIIAGASSYSLKIDFKKFKEIADEVGAYLLADISHLAGLIISNNHPNCFPYADVAMSTTHKQLMGPRGAIIMWNNENLTKKINCAVFPGTQGGPQPQLIAAKAIALSKANEPIFKNYYNQVCKNALIMCSTFKKLRCKIVFNTTETHLFILNVAQSFNLNGQEAEALLEKINISVNKNVIPGDLSPNSPSGIRIGTLTGTSLNFKEKEFKLIAETIYNVLLNNLNKSILLSSKKTINNLMKNQSEYKDEKI